MSGRRRYTSGMKNLGVALGLLVAVALAGCAGTDASVPAQTTGAAAPSAAPITLTPTESAAPEPGTDDDFLAGITYSWRGAVPNDTELLGARDLACAQLRAGAARTDVVVVEGDGEDADWNNDHLISSAIQFACPDVEG